MKKLTFELNADQVDDIITQELLWAFNNFKKDLKQRKKNTGLVIFDTNPKEDVKHIQQHIDALKLILQYYGVKV